MVIAKKYVLRNHYHIWPKTYDLKLVEEELPPLEDGEFLVEAEYLSVDPFMKSLEPMSKIGSTFIGTQVARIIESKNKYFPEGRHVTACFGWRTHTISNGTSNGEYPAPVLLPELGKLPVSLGVGILGIPGVTAYYGITDICQPKKGDTVVVSGASSTVGNIAGQIAKIKGCTVIGISESDEKGKWLTNELGFDYHINQKKDNVQQNLQKYAPNGVDCFFDNVGGDISTKVLNNMNTLGRVSVCGFHQNYSNEDSMFNFNKAAIVQPSVLRKQLRIQGYLVSRYTDWTDAIYQNLMWVQEGSLKYNELIIEGFHNMTNAFVEMVKDSNTSTVIVKVPVEK